MFIFSTFQAGAAVLHQTVRRDCQDGANLSAVHGGPIGELVDVQLEKVAIVERNALRALFIPSIELWRIDLIAHDQSRSALIVVQDQDGAEAIADNVRKAQTVEWIGPCYVGFRLDGVDVHASMDPMIDSPRWVRVAR